jgi:hypothetical protein
MNRITLSGRNDKIEPRTVYLDGREIGRVVPDRGSWIAYDARSREHGRWWLTDWYAADALRRIPTS